MANQYDLGGEVAIVTGGAQGIGLACARLFASSGAKVFLWDIDEYELEAAKAELGAAVSTSVVDITDCAAVDAAAAQVVQSAGKVSILLNSAGIAGLNTTVEDYPVEEWHRVIELNLHGTFYTNRAVVPHMKSNGYGRIVNIASIAGKEGNPNASAYSASKAAVIGFTKSLGKELAGENIAVNCITPAAARTRIFDQMSEEHIAYMLSKIPRGRFVETGEIAGLVAWLVSRENSFTTAGVFDLSGGRATY
ncbi:MAG: SDR family NAD(P)-dependent oxidoreductase [Pseudomonadota bacterium]